MSHPFYHEQIPQPPSVEDQSLAQWMRDVTDAINARKEVEPYREEPTSITVTAGGTPVGTVANVQTPFDGNVYQVPETATTPGYDVKFNFTGLTFAPNAIVYRMWYEGLSNHEVTVELYDYEGSAYEIIHQQVNSLTYVMGFIPFLIDGRFVNSDNEAIVRFIHNTGGSTHDVYWDYVSLWKFT